MENRINVAAHRLAIGFSDDSDIPSRYKKNTKQKRISAESSIERSFKENVQHWRNVVNNILAKNDKDIAWRIIYLSPKIQPGVNRLTECDDFVRFNDYLVLRMENELLNAV
jgi:hypothetical protein